MRLLIIEDDSATAMSLELMLKHEGFNVYTTDLGEEGVDLAKTYDYDVITLDLNLPDMSGLDVLRHIRAAKVSTPVLVLTGDQRVETKVKAFGQGADDYMTKPVHKDELVCRLHAVVRRSKGHTSSKIVVGPIVVNLDQKTVEVNGIGIHLTGKEYAVLELLALRKGSTITKDMFVNHLYGGMDEPEIKIVDVFICKVRRKLEIAGAKGFISTVWGQGYTLSETPTPTPNAATTGIPKSNETRPNRILVALESGPKTFAELASEVRLDGHGLRSYLGRLMVEHHVASIGTEAAPAYEITGRGRAHLQQVERERAA